MAGNPTPRTLFADTQNTARETFVYDDSTPRDDTIKNFDNLSGSTYVHDKVDLTGLFDAIGGTYSDGNNDLQDRINALDLTFGDFDGDGQTDARLTVKGLSNFQITFSNPVSPYKGGFDIGSGLGIYDDIAVKSDQVAPTMPTTQTITSGNNAYLADEQHKIADSFIVKPDATGNHTIWNFDNITSDNTAHDQIDLSDLFDAIGGKYADGVNDFADRQAALQYQTGDFNGDGQNDVRVTIQGHDGFALTLLDPVNAFGTSFDTAASGTSADLLLGGTAPSTTPTPSTPTTPVPTTPTTPTTTPTPSTGGNGLFEGKFPAHWARMDNGINIEQSEYWKMTASDFQYLKSIGVQNVRLAISYNLGLDKYGDNFAANPEYQNLFKVMDLATKAGIAVSVSPFSDNNGNRLLSSQANIDQFTQHWVNFTKYVDAHYDPKDVFLEIYNEPFATDYNKWWAVQGNVINAIHAVAPEFTVVADSNGVQNGDWSFIDSLTSQKAYNDPNVAYAIHYYEGGVFNIQGTTGAVGDFTGYKNVPYPVTNPSYVGYGINGQTMMNDMQRVADWAAKNNTYVTANEWGVVHWADEASKARWYHDMTTAMDANHIGWDIFEYSKSNKWFDVNTNGLNQIPDAVLKAIGWGPYQDASSNDWNGTGTTSPSSPSTPTTPTTPSTGTTTYTADSSFATAEKFTLAATDLTKTVTINNFDSVSGSATGIKDQVDINAVFHAIGIDDWNARKAAMHLTSVDLNHDGHMDLQLTIDGAPNFHLNFINPNNADVSAFDIGSGHGVYDNILIA